MRRGEETVRRPFGITLLAVIFGAAGSLRILEAVFALLCTGNLGYALASTAFPFLSLWYLSRSSVKTAFRITEES